MFMDTESAFVMSQTESPLLSLPGELRNEIYTLSMTPSAPIVNPSWDAVIRPKHQQTPHTSAALLRTCRSIYLEANSSVLLKDSQFVFTRVAHIEAFFSRLTKTQCSSIRGITIDLREAASGDVACRSERSISIGNEWLHYLFCTHGVHPMGAWCSKLSTLRSDIPDIKELCIDMTEWQPKFAASRLEGWKYLQSLLRKPKGLECFTLKGKCLDSSFWNPKPVPWGLGPWFSPALAKDESALVDLIGQVVREEEENEVKIFEWRVVDGISILTVRIHDDVEQSGLSSMKRGKALPEDGIMLWQEFLEFKNLWTSSNEERKLSEPSGGVVPFALPSITV